MAWIFDMDTCPIDEAILLAATPDWVGQAIKLPDQDAGPDVYYYEWAGGGAGAGRLHPNLKPIAWMSLPAFPFEHAEQSCFEPTTDGLAYLLNHAIEECREQRRWGE